MEIRKSRSVVVQSGTMLFGHRNSRGQQDVHCNNLYEKFRDRLVETATKSRNPVPTWAEFVWHLKHQFVPQNAHKTARKR